MQINEYIGIINEHIDDVITFLIAYISFMLAIVFLKNEKNIK